MSKNILEKTTKKQSYEMKSLTDNIPHQDTIRLIQTYSNLFIRAQIKPFANFDD